MPTVLAKKKDRKWFKKIIKFDSELSEKETESALLKTFIFIVSFGLFNLFVGTGIGSGYKMSKKIEKGEIEYNDHLRFISGETSKVEIVRTNSVYIFYLEKENKKVQITPISGIIKSIENNK